jgi:hypothetical protein
VPFAALEEVTADELNAALPIAPAVKSADETVTSSTTLQNDDHLLVAVASNTTYLLELVFMFNANASGDLKTTFTVPSGTTGTLCATTDAGSSAGISMTSTPVWDGTGADEQARLWGRVVTSATSGTIRLQWAQNASFGTGTIIRNGSFLRITRIS